MKSRRNLIVGIILGTATTVAVLTSVVPGKDEVPPEIATITASGEAVNTPATPSSVEPCAYQWAYQDMPKLTTSFDTAIKTLYPNAQGRAQAFGENCLRSDGSNEFLAMETDFYIRVQVETLTDKMALGNLISHVMEIVLKIPPEELQGPKMGFVEFSFERSEMERVIIRVPIENYNLEGQGSTGVDLFELYYTPQP